MESPVALRATGRRELSGEREDGRGMEHHRGARAAAAEPADAVSGLDERQGPVSSGVAYGNDESSGSANPVTTTHDGEPNSKRGSVAPVAVVWNNGKLGKECWDKDEKKRGANGGSDSATNHLASPGDEVGDAVATGDTVEMICDGIGGSDDVSGALGIEGMESEVLTPPPAEENALVAVASTIPALPSSETNDLSEVVDSAVPSPAMSVSKCNHLRQPQRTLVTQRPEIGSTLVIRDGVGGSDDVSDSLDGGVTESAGLTMASATASVPGVVESAVLAPPSTETNEHSEVVDSMGPSPPANKKATRRRKRPQRELGTQRPTTKATTRAQAARTEGGRRAAEHSDVRLSSPATSDVITSTDSVLATKQSAELEMTTTKGVTKATKDSTPTERTTGQTVSWAVPLVHVPEQYVEVETYNAPSQPTSNTRTKVGAKSARRRVLDGSRKRSTDSTNAEESKPRKASANGQTGARKKTNANDQLSKNPVQTWGEVAITASRVPNAPSDELEEQTLQLTDNEIIAAPQKSRLVQRMLSVRQHKGMKIETKYGLVVVNTPRGRRVVLPPALWSIVLKELHGTIYAGHFRGPHTYVRIARVYWWPGLHREVNRWVRGCQECGSRKARPRQVIPPLRSLRGGDVGDRWALDVAGPFPIAGGGERYVVAALEYVTRYVVARSVTEHTAERVAKFIMEDVVLRFGAFRELLTVGAPEMTGHVLETLVEILQAKQTNPVPYRPQMIGLVERFQRTWKDCVATFMSSDVQDDWSDWVPCAVYAYNSAQYSTVALSPNELMMGRRLRPPNELLRQTERKEAGDPMQYHGRLMAAMQRAHESAGLARAKEQQRQARYYDRKVRGRRGFEVGGCVGVYNPPRGPKATKFVHRWMGSMLVIEPAGFENFVLKREDKNGKTELMVAHASFIISYHTPISLLELAADDIAEQLEYEDSGAGTADEPTTTAAVFAAASSSSGGASARTSRKRGPTARDTNDYNRHGPNLVGVRRRKRRNRAGQYVVEHELEPTGSDNMKLLWAVSFRRSRETNTHEQPTKNQWQPRTSGREGEAAAEETRPRMGNG